MVNGYRTVLLQVVYDFVQVFRIVYRHRYAYFRSADHVDGGLVAFEDLEYLAQESVSQQHTAGFDLDGCYVVLGGHCLDFTFFRFVGNQGTRGRRFHRIQQAYRDIGIFSGLYTGRMENLGAEISQFCGFFEVQLTHRRSLVHHARVVVVHTVDVCPYLDFRSVDGRTDQGCRIVASTALQVVHLTVGVAADESLGDVDFLTRMSFQLLCQFLADVVQVRLAVLVCPHEIQCRQQCRLDALFAQVVGHHVGRDDFSLGQNDLFFEQGKDIFCIGTDVVKY